MGPARPVEALTLAECQQLFREGWTISELADRLGVSWLVARAWVRDAG